MNTYKTHLAKRLGKGKVSMATSQCGRSLVSNDKLTVIVNTLGFKNSFIDDGERAVCSKCLAALRIIQAKNPKEA